MNMENVNFEMVAKTFHGLEEVLAEELRALGAVNVEPGRRMVAFEGDLEMMYRANMACRTALRILKPLYKFIAPDTDTLYDLVKEYDWSTLLTPSKTFSIDTVSNSEIFTNSRFATYRVKDAIVDWFKDKYGPDVRPGVRLQDADVMINVHIDADRVTISLDSSGESLHKRGYRVAQTEAPINEVLAAGMILKSGWRGDCPLVDPMCGSGTFLIEAALIATGIMPGIYRRRFAFESWPDFNEELFEKVYNDDSGEKDFDHKIYGGDISPKAIAIAEQNIQRAGVGRYIDIAIRPLSQWEEAPEEGTPGVMVTNPPYGERISVDDMDGLYETLGSKLKHVFKGYHAWIIGYNEEHFRKIGLAPSVKEMIYNGSLECELREYVIFEGDYKAFRSEGGSIKEHVKRPEERKPSRRLTDEEWSRDARRRGFGGKDGGKENRGPRRFRDLDDDDFKGRRRDSRNKDDRRGGGRPQKFERRRDDKFGDRYSDRSRRRDESRSAEPRNPLEERYRPERGRRFGEPARYGKHNEHLSDRPGQGRYDQGEKPGRASESRRESEERSENPLAMRRNPYALKALEGRRPQLPPDEEKTVMRSRKKKDDNNKQ